MRWNFSSLKPFVQLGGSGIVACKAAEGEEHQERRAIVVDAAAASSYEMMMGYAVKLPSTTSSIHKFKMF